MTMRLDVGFRVGPTTNTVKVVYPTGGALVDVTLTDGLYMTAEALADEINTRLQAYNAHLFCLWDAAARTYTIRTDLANFDLQLTQPTLRSFLGVPLSTKYTNVTGVTGTTPGVFLSSLPWRDTSFTWARTSKDGPRHHLRATSVALAQWREWSVAGLITAAEISAFDTIAGYLCQGLPFTLALDASITTAWSFTNWFGRRSCILAPGQDGVLGSWLTRPHQTVQSLALELREFAA